LVVREIDSEDTERINPPTDYTMDYSSSPLEPLFPTHSAVDLSGAMFHVAAKGYIATKTQTTNLKDSTSRNSIFVEILWPNQVSSAFYLDLIVIPPDSPLLSFAQPPQRKIVFPICEDVSLELVGLQLLSDSGSPLYWIRAFESFVLGTMVTSRVCVSVISRIRDLAVRVKMFLLPSDMFLVSVVSGHIDNMEQLGSIGQRSRKRRPPQEFEIPSATRSPLTTSPSSIGVLSPQSVSQARLALDPFSNTILDPTLSVPGNDSSTETLTFVTPG